ncbi:MAG: SIMPL domain-containing protein [Anaerolineaceae bacterium]|nr:SIMPL domain-containing protein [Anaerolineaceae bacterium]
MKKITVLLFILAAILMLSACALPVSNSSDTENARQITVNGTGEVYLEPDVAYVTLGVRSESEEASSAVSENNELADDIINALSKMGIEEKDIQTKSFNVYWTEEWQGEGEPFKKHYIVENMLDVTIRDIETLGETLDAALGAGANSVYNVRFDVTDKSKALTTAREIAVENAQTQAEEFTSAAGVTLGELMTISAYDVGSIIEPMYARGMGGGGDMAMESSMTVPMSGGQLVVQVTVNMIYALED